MENLNLIKPEKVQNIINKFCYTIGMIPTSYKMSLTYEEQIIAIGHYLEETVIPALNNNAEAVAELQNLFIELKNYVDNYFDNLDVQTEINNKLDQMAQDGELANIIEHYIQLQGLLCYDTVNDMKNATNLVNGSFTKTYGFYAKNDGGSAFYKIRTLTNEDVVNNMNLIALSNDNSLVAELMTDIVNVLQFGAKGDGVTDDTNVLQYASNYAETNNLEYIMPFKNYLCSNLTLNNINFIKLNGVIKFTSDEGVLNIFENVNSGITPNIYVNKVTNGTILMKGLNSADVTIQNANKLNLYADNTEGHNFIGYTKFYLGFVRYLNISDDGSGTKWINENLFFGGRFLGITFDGQYNHQNNLFFKPMCEHTNIHFKVGCENRIIDARLEGTNVSITFEEGTFGNIITCNFASTLQSKYLPKYFYLQNITDYSKGKNKFIINEDLTEHNVLNLNVFNNPKSVATEKDCLKPGGGTTLFETDFIAVPDTIISLFTYFDNQNVAFRIECYDENQEKITVDPQLLTNSPSLGITSQGTYGNPVYNKNILWAIIDNHAELVKYIKVKFLTPPTATNELYKSIQMYLTYYGKLENEGYYLSGLSHSI